MGFEQILENLPCGCVVFDGDGKMTYVNSNICDNLEYLSDQLLGLDLDILLTISSRIFFQTHIFPMIRLQGKANEIFLNLKSKTGGAVPVMVNVKSIQENEKIFFIGTFATVWERQKYEQELIQAKKSQEKANQENDPMQQILHKFEISRQQLDNNLALLTQRNEEYLQIGKVLTHDMHEPIRKITLFFQTLLDQNRIQQDKDDLRKIDVINRSIFRLRKLTDALFDFVTLTLGNEDFVFISVADLIKDAELEVKRLLNTEPFTVQIGNMHGFFGRPSHIRRVFIELLKNAAQNRDVNRPLLIQIGSSEVKSNSYQFDKEKYNFVDHVQIEFIDNGIGFESQFDSHIFSLSSKLNKNSDGIGLGLTICKQIVAQHGGSIKANSILGEETTFTILLPVIQP